MREPLNSLRVHAWVIGESPGWLLVPSPPRKPRTWAHLQHARLIWWDSVRRATFLVCKLVAMCHKFSARIARVWHKELTAIRVSLKSWAASSLKGFLNVCSQTFAFGISRNLSIFLCLTMMSVHGNPYASCILEVAIFGVVLSTLSFALRIWARSLSNIKFWYDDLLMTFAMVFNFYIPFTVLHLTIARHWRICLGGLLGTRCRRFTWWEQLAWRLLYFKVLVKHQSYNIYAGLRFGLGSHVVELLKKDADRYAQESSMLVMSPLVDTDSNDQTVFALSFRQVINTNLIRISYFLLYKRTFQIKSMRYAIYAVGAIIFGSALSSILSFAVQCTLIARFWNPERPAHCLNQQVISLHLHPHSPRLETWQFILCPCRHFGDCTWLSGEMLNSRSFSHLEAFIYS